MKIFDTHAHLDLDPLKTNITTLIFNGKSEKFQENIAKIGDFSLDGAILPGITLESSQKVIELSQYSNFFHAAVGIHPNSAAQANQTDWKEIVKLVDFPKVVAVGETGLDRYWNDTPFELQIDYFNRHLDLAEQQSIPVLIHCRDCDEEMKSVLEKREHPIRGVMHAFSSTPQMAESYIDMGLFVSFAGSVTYTNKKFAPLWEAAKIVPDDRLLVETDSPFMIPHPYRGRIPYNEPIMAAFVVKRLAELRGQTDEYVAKITTENAKRLFKL